jgi:hypothetical protein
MTGVRLLEKARPSSSPTPADKHWMSSDSYAIGTGPFSQAPIVHQPEREPVADFLLLCAPSQPETVLAAYNYRINIASILYLA